MFPGQGTKRLSGQYRHLCIYTRTSVYVYVAVLVFLRSSPLQRRDEGRDRPAMSRSPGRKRNAAAVCLLVSSRPEDSQTSSPSLLSTLLPLFCILRFFLSSVLGLKSNSSALLSLFFSESSREKRKHTRAEPSRSGSEGELLPHLEIDLR